MSVEVSDREQYRLFHEAYHEYGYIVCDGCGREVDLSDADDLDGAVDIWNDHVRSVHDGGESA